MGKVLFVLDLPEPALRKAKAPPVRPHKDKKLYSRKEKHKNSSAKTEEFLFLRVPLFFL